MEQRGAAVGTMVRGCSLVRRAAVVAALGMFGAVGFPLPGAGPSPAAAAPPCTVSWSSSAGGEWHIGANWSGGQMPTPADDVCIDLPGDYWVILTGPAEI